MKNFRLFLALIFLMGVIQATLTPAATIHSEFAAKRLHLADKLHQSFHLSIQLKKYTHIWIIYRLDKGITPVEKILPLFTSIKRTRLVDILSDSTKSPELNNRRRMASLPFAGMIANNSELKADDCFIAIKYFLQSGRPRLLQIDPLTLHSFIDQQNIPLFWLGTVSAEKSFSYLKHLFKQEQHEQLQRQLVRAMSFHNQPAKFYSFAKDILKNKFSERVKRDAILGLGNYPDSRNLRLLALISQKSISLKLRKIAVHAISQNKNISARQLLKHLAIRARNSEIRKEAIFWLSQFNDRASFNTLLTILEKCQNSEIKEYTIFAISQSPDEMGRLILKKIAEQNPDPELRETAIYWMGQTDEQKKLDFMIEFFNSVQN